MIPSEKMSWTTSTLALARGVSNWEGSLDGWGIPGKFLGCLWGLWVPGKFLGCMWGLGALEKGLWPSVGL